MSTFRTAGDIPPTGNKSFDAWLRAFRFFGQLKTWTPTIDYPGVTITGTPNAVGNYLRLGPAVLYFIRASFNITAGVSPYLNVSLPFPPNATFASGLYCTGAFYVFGAGGVDFVPAFIDATGQQLLVPKDNEAVGLWGASPSEFSGFGFYWI